jgi:Transcriptional regulator
MPDGKQQRVLVYALKRFMSSGYSAVSMDEIARGCGISKATLYTLFSSKEALMLACVDFIADQIHSKVSAVISDPDLPLGERMERFFAPVAQMLAHISPAALNDIRRTMPEAFDKINETRRRLVLQNIGALIDEGKKAGLVRPNVDKNIVVHMIIGTATHIIDPDVLLEFGQTPDRILDSVKTIVVRGCLTDEGLKQFDGHQ